MCEWLSSGEWHDVQLLCGGRSFNAHRAVLASVSNFLRNILLSCPIDESPVFIVLPEFDLEAMTSVLYYIYNGEVLISNHKLKMFLDITKAMDIFIDEQYIPKFGDYVQYSNLHTDKKYLLRNCDRRHLKLRKGANSCYVNIKKGMNIEEVLRQLQLSLGGLDFHDKPSRYHSLIEGNIPDLVNQTTLSGFRQRQSFLRDIFIETYSQNGNGNGLTAGVLEISNERYLGPTSVLLTNANGKHPSANDTLLNTSERMSERNSHVTSIFDSHKQLQCIPDGNKNSSKEFDTNDCNSFLLNKIKASQFNFNCTLENISKNINKDSSWGCHFHHTLPSILIPMDPTPKKISESQWTSSNLCSTKNVSDISLGNENKELNRNESNQTIAKCSILNEVLQSPWHPRQPNNYKPFRKKHRSTKYSNPSCETNMNRVVSSDNNNNPSNCASPTKVNDITTYDTDNIADIIKSNLDECGNKCTICSQVFSSTEDYNVHMKRHSSLRRYSCGECDKTFSQLRNFKYHMSIHRGTKEFATTCPVCGKYFNDRGYLSSHMKIHRNRKEYKCASCPKSFNQRVAYNMHVRIHTGVKPHVCEECGKAFSRKMLLKQHQRTHSGERPYACAHCDKRFADRSNMTLHLRLHTGIKPFSCTMCPKSFTKKHHLKSHLNFHTGAKPYSCPRCKLAFTQSSNMRTHLKKCNISLVIQDGS